MGLAVLPRMIGRGLGRLYRVVVPKYNPSRRDAARRIAVVSGATALGILSVRCKEKAPSSKVKTKGKYKTVTKISAKSEKAIKISTNNIFDNNLWKKVWKDYGVKMSIPQGQSTFANKHKIKVRIAKNVADVKFVGRKARYGSYRQDNMGQGVRELHIAIPRVDDPVLCYVARLGGHGSGHVARFKFEITYKNGKTKDLEIDYVSNLNDPREITRLVEEALKENK